MRHPEPLDPNRTEWLATVVRGAPAELDPLAAALGVPARTMLRGALGLPLASHLRDALTAGIDRLRAEGGQP